MNDKIFKINIDEKVSDKIYHREDGIYEPFVYIILENTTKKKYVGYRVMYRGKKCLESDLGNIYFTSSKNIKDKWKNDKNSFTILEIIPCYRNIDAIYLEGIILIDNNSIKSDDYLNIGYNGFAFNFSGKLLSDEHKEKLRLIRIGENNPFYGKTHTKESKDKISSASSGKNNGFYGRTHTEETKKILSEKSKITSKGRKHSKETIKKQSDIHKKRPKKLCEHCNQMISINAYEKWHNHNCKMKNKEV
jgi:hypothetical protein